MNLISKIENKEATIAIVGLGYVGIPLALIYVEAGFKVIGIDIDNDKVDLLNKGLSYIEHIKANRIKSAIANDFKATTDFSEIKNVDAIIICVPTPLNAYREPDLSFVLNTTKALVPFLKNDTIISLESTTYPGTTDEELKPIIENAGFIVGKDVYLTFSPEREDPGNEIYNTKTIPKICGGVTKKCLEVGVKLYSKVLDSVIPVSSTRVAEMTKLLENIHRAVNIGLVNEMKIISDKMDIDIHEVIRAAATKPFGFVPYFPGPGIGGHCIPIDPFYLTWKAREYGFHTRFIELAGEINDSMPVWVIDKVIFALNQISKPVKGSKILILGIAYKKNVDDMRESPSVIIMEKLRELGAEISYCDPHVPVFPKMRQHKFDLKSIVINQNELKKYDLVILATNHDAFDYNLIKEESNLIVDTRGVFKGNDIKIIKA
jgi:UDP-N-acetyl-D-glucosamine dehydrogenase